MIDTEKQTGDDFARARKKQSVGIAENNDNFVVTKASRMLFAQLMLWHSDEQVTQQHQTHCKDVDAAVETVASMSNLKRERGKKRTK